MSEIFPDINRSPTIFALSSGAGRAGVAIIRVSGPAVAHVIHDLTGKPLPQPRKAQLRWLVDPETGGRLDQGIVLWFPAPGSFTGEDVAEFHIHGGRAVIDGLLGAIGRLPGLYPAVAGEFTRRAFDNGRMDLTEIEGLADLINADTEAQRRQALRQMDGALGAMYESWRSSLIESLALLEALIDFSDEDLGDGIAEAVERKITGLTKDIERHLSDGWRGERLRDGFRIAILGAPNAGKSTLLNALARRDVAIVSDIAGTTRDVIDVNLDLGGYAVMVADTAGIREAGDAIEREGIRRALGRAGEADLKIILADAQKWPNLDAGLQNLIDNNSLIIVNKIDLGIIVNKIDLGAGDAGPDFASGEALGVWRLSAKTGEGLAAFLSDLTKIVTQRLAASGGEAPPMTRERHRRALEEALSHLKRFLVFNSDIELRAEDLRLAARALGRITGRVDVEDVLDVIFSEFCIGK